MEAAQGVLTGQAPTVPGAPIDTDATGTDLAAPVAPGEEEVDLSLDANLDTEDEPEAGAALGRERR